MSSKERQGRALSQALPVGGSHDCSSIYAAHPITAYGTEWAERQLARLAKLFPDAVIMDPADMYADTRDWLRRWPLLLADIDYLIFFDDEQGCVGGGVIREVLDACACNVPVDYLAPSGKLVPLGKVGLSVLGKDLRRWAEVCISRRPQQKVS